MATVALEQFLPEVLLECHGVPNPVAINALRNACYDFCRDSLLWSEKQDAQPYSTGVAEYQLDPVTDAQILTVLTLNIDGKMTIYPWVPEDVAAARPGWASDQGVIAGFIQTQPDTINLIAVPDGDGTFTPTVAYAPTRTATTVDARLYNQHLETIKYGALWKLKMMAGQAWADPAGASYYENHFWMGVNAATVERNRGSSRAAMRVSPRPFV
jgi:hypothetical protein